MFTLFDYQGVIQKELCLKENREHYSHKGAKNVIEADFESETTILRERQLVPFA